MACKIMMAEGPNEESNMRIYIMLIVLGSASGVALSQDAIVTTTSITFPKTNSSHLKMGHPESKFIFQASIFRR